jgi:RNA-directed DNA polymerase
MPGEQRDPAVNNFPTTLGGKGEMTKAPIKLQDLRRKIYLEAKADKSKRFWGLYVHISKLETLKEAYRLTRKNNGAPGIDGVTFEMIEKSGPKAFLLQIQNELISGEHLPKRNRQKAIPKSGSKVSMLAIPAIGDRVVQGALKLILEPIFEFDFQEGSYGYRPKRTAHAAVDGVASAVVKNKVRIVDVDLASYFNNIRHDILLNKVAERVNDDKVM